MSFYLWEPAGIKFKKLIDIIVEEAIKENKSKKDNIIKYDSAILKKTKGLKR
jgi:D-alanine-D-alanine ligase